MAKALQKINDLSVREVLNIRLIADILTDGYVQWLSDYKHRKDPVSIGDRNRLSNYIYRFLSNDYETLIVAAYYIELRKIKKEGNDRELPDASSFVYAMIDSRLNMTAHLVSADWFEIEKRALRLMSLDMESYLREGQDHSAPVRLLRRFIARHYRYRIARFTAFVQQYASPINCMLIIDNIMHTIRNNAARSNPSKKVEPQGKDNNETLSDAGVVDNNKCSVGTQTYKSDLVSLYKMHEPRPTMADLWAGEATKNMMSSKREVQATQTDLSFREQKEEKYRIVIKGLSKGTGILVGSAGQAFTFCILLLGFVFAVVQLFFVKLADKLIEARERFYEFLEVVAGKPDNVLALDPEKMSCYLNLIDYDDLPAEEERRASRFAEKEGGALLEASAEQFPGKPKAALGCPSI